MRKLIIIIIVLFSLNSLAQEEPKNWELNGYIKNLQNTWITSTDGNWMSWNTFHNRINFKYYPNDKLTVVAGLRNNFSSGQLIQMAPMLIPDYVKNQGEDAGIMDLTWTPIHDTSYLLVSNIDRLYLDYAVGDLQIRAGRQRINWGVGLVWNPNDIFNSFSFLDFDYEERPGSDAIKVEYYTSYTSSLQLVAKVDHKNEYTMAAMYRFNKWNYDYQIIGGFSPEDYIIGLGWSGDIKGAGFRGESTYFHDKENVSDTTGVLVASLDFDYTLKSGLYFHTAALYNSNGTTDKAGWGQNVLMNQEISAKQFSLAKYSLFAQISYPISPLVSADLSAIFNPNDHSLYYGPSVNVSVAENWSVFLITQLFAGETGSEYGDNGVGIAYLRLKWSF